MKINWPKFIRRTILLTLVAAAAGIFFANRYVTRYGFNNVFDFLAVWAENKSLANEHPPENLQILISDEDYEFLKSRRDEAIARGIQINEGDTYVPCEVLWKDDTISGELRLKGHMLDHLEGNKWSFRLKTDEPVMGMTRFSLQNPATRNYEYEWIYHQLMKSEDIIHLRYDFLNLTLNDEVLGIYALEEHFGQHVLENCGRAPGPILRWNPGLYWEGRIDEMKWIWLDEQYSDFSSSFVEPYEKGTVKKDSVLVDSYLKGSDLLEKFRRGDLQTTDAFDVKKMASFLAIIDLVGGHHSLDWSDLKFYYNGQSGKMEPVAYESFSVRKSEVIAGQRPTNDFDLPEFDYYARLFSDSKFFEEYIQAVERICNERYFGEFTATIQKELDEKIGVLANEFPYRKSTLDPYYENIQLIRHNLSLPKPFHAFTESSTDSTVVISLAPVSDFPIEIVSLNIDEKVDVVNSELFYLPAKPRDAYPVYFTIPFQFASMNVENLVLTARIPGSSNFFQVEVSDLPAWPDSIKFAPWQRGEDKLKWEGDSVAYFEGDDILIDKNLSLGANTHLKILPGQKLEFDATIVSQGQISILGTEEHPVTLTTKSGGFQLDSGTFRACYVDVTSSKSELIQASGSDMQFESCNFSGLSAPAVSSMSSVVRFVDCIVADSKLFGKYVSSEVWYKNVYAFGGENLFVATGSNVKAIDCIFRGFDKVAQLDRISRWKCWKSVYRDNVLIASLDNASLFHDMSGDMQSGNTGFEMDMNSSLAGESKYILFRTQKAGLQNLEKRR